MTVREPTFLEVNDVLEIHAQQLAAIGGGSGDKNLIAATLERLAIRQ